MAILKIPYPYTILRPIKSGGIGEIYLAYHENLRKQVVVKKVKDHCLHSIDYRIEVDILKNLHHQYLPQVYDFLQVEDGIYTVMDYIPGYDLEYYCSHGKKFSEEQLLCWLKQLLEVLEYLHTRTPQIVHCDIKPANIMITENGNVCLIDFNISIDGESNKELIGLSSQFASPEQTKKAEMILHGENADSIVLDGRSDLYSLGAVFYFLMTGIYPSGDRENFIELKYTEHPYSDALENIIEKAMQPNLKKRFKNAQEMQAAVDDIEAWTTVRLRRKQRLHCLAGIAAGIALIGIVIGIYVNGRTAYTEYVNSVDAYIYKEENCSYLSQETENIRRLMDEGMKMLNAPEYVRYLKKDRKRKAELLYAVSRSALQIDKYEEAMPMLSEAVELDSENAVYYRALAIAQAGTNEIDEANQTLEEARSEGLDLSDALLLKAELNLKKGQAQKAYDILLYILPDLSEDVMIHAVDLLFQAAEDTKNVQGVIKEVEENADKMSDSIRSYWFRRAGQLALQYDDYENACVCLENVVASQIFLVEDFYNLDAAYEKLGEWKKSQSLLTNMTEIYPEEYMACIRLAYVEYRIENQKRPADQNYNSVFLWYEKAVDRMRLAGKSAGSEPEMVQLESIVAQLEKLGWKKE